MVSSQLSAPGSDVISFHYTGIKLFSGDYVTLMIVEQEYGEMEIKIHLHKQMITAY